MKINAIYRIYKTLKGVNHQIELGILMIYIEKVFCGCSFSIASTSCLW